jgi:Ca2+-transporting ATPase
VWVKIGILTVSHEADSIKTTLKNNGVLQMEEVKSEQSLRYKGLTTAEAEASRLQYGNNIITPPERDPWWKMFLEKFDDPVIRILIIAAIIAIGVGIVDGRIVEGIGIVIAILLATTLAFVNEYRASQEFEILNQVNEEVPIKVVRNSHVTVIPRKDLVKGDIVLLELGDEVPADGNVLQAISLEVNEARLTGEAIPVSKLATEDIKHEADAEEEMTFPPDRVFRGTMVVDGNGVIELNAVGDSSYIAGILRESTTIETGEETPLNRQLDRLSKAIGVIGLLVALMIFVTLMLRGLAVGELSLTGSEWFFTGILFIALSVALSPVWLTIAYDAFELVGRERERPEWVEDNSLAAWGRIIGIGVVVFFIGLVIGNVLNVTTFNPGEWLPQKAGESFLSFFMIAVTIIVVAVPEGLAMSVTLSLAYSMRKMTATNNLVRRMNACETIGASTVICSDKTGTLTLNEMRVSEIDFPTLNGQTVSKGMEGEREKLIAQAISVNSTAHLEWTEDGDVQPLGNPTEGALLLWLNDMGVDYDVDRLNFDIESRLTFSNDRKFMATLGKSYDAENAIMHVKGAPEIVLARCSQIQVGDGLEDIDAHKSSIEKSLLEYQERGMRTLGFAYQNASSMNDHSFEDDDTFRNLIWLGSVAIADPVREEVAPAIQACREAGISVKIVTGDNPQTAQEIARQIGLWEDSDNGKGLHITGKEFNKLDDKDAAEVVKNLKILSRARPMDKLRLVRLLKQDNENVVAVTGDGTNDAPALNYADVGLAMGHVGTSVAKEASDIVLLDDSFGSIVNAIMWGRSLYSNIQRFILFQLTINVAALAIAFLGPFIGIEFPLTVTQMLWVNLIMDTFAALALATEPPSWSVMRRPPRNPNAFIVNAQMARGIFGVGAIFVVVLVGLILAIQDDGVISDYDLSFFFTVFIMLQFWNLFNARVLGSTESALRGITSNRNFLMIAITIFIGQIVFVQIGGDIFRTVPLAFSDWVLIIAATSLVLWTGELWRLMQRRRQHQTR